VLGYAFVAKICSALPYNFGQNHNLIECTKINNALSTRKLLTETCFNGLYNKNRTIKHAIVVKLKI